MKFVFSAIASAFRERRAVHQRIPDVTRHDVERVVRRDFLPEQVDTVMRLLDEYATGSLRIERARVLLAALKLANGDLHSLRRHIGAANHDYRDVLMAAEYPEYAKAGVRVAELPRKERRRIVNSDWDQYQKWLGR